MRNAQQKLGKRNTYIPTNASQVCSSVVLSLNREDTLSEQGLKTSPNNLDVNQRQRIGGLNAKVFVMNIEGKPLMPCKPAKARHLLRDKKAIVLSRKPFTIKLLFECDNKTQQITLGIDAGYSKIGFSATSEKSELICGEIELRKDMSKKLGEKAIYRRLKRNKLWYRQARFLNRGVQGWLAPSIKHKLETHIKLVEKIKSLLPISNIIVEVASFDQQKMMNPKIDGVKYQQGELQGYEVREYLLEKFKRTCVYCKRTDVPLQIEHIIPKSRGGSDRVSNLTISCEKCNLRKNNMTAEEFGFPTVQNQAKESLKATSFMNNIKKMIVELLCCESTFGFITKHHRIRLGLEKTHYNDAFVISEGKNQERTNPFIMTQFRRNNRCLQTNRMGFKPSIRRQRYSIQSNDKVIHNKKIYLSKGVFCIGKWVHLIDSFGNKIDKNIKNVKVITYGKGIIFS